MNQIKRCKPIYHNGKINEPRAFCTKYQLVPLIMSYFLNSILPCRYFLYDSIITSIPGQGMTFFWLFSCGSKGGDIAAEDSILDKPGMLRVPCWYHVGGISWGVTSCRLFLETGSRVDRLIGRGVGVAVPVFNIGGVTIKGGSWITGSGLGLLRMTRSRSSMFKKASSLWKLEGTFLPVFVLWLSLMKYARVALFDFLESLSSRTVFQMVSCSVKWFKNGYQKGNWYH